MTTRTKSFFLTPEAHAYLIAHGTPPDSVQRELIEETTKLGGVSVMQVAPEQGAFMTLLARLMGAKRAIEVGTFTGYSSLCIARGLAEGGSLLCCDVNDEWGTIARRAWEKAGVADRVELVIAPALETLTALREDPDFDLAFIDADKTSYQSYYEEILKRLRPGGVILVDNVLWGGSVVDPEVRDEQTAAIRAFNDRIAADDRVESVMLAISDGLTLIRKR